MHEMCPMAGARETHSVGLLEILSETFFANHVPMRDVAAAEGERE
jgi:hypothetical protein